MGTLSKNDLENIKYVIVEVQLNRQSTEKLIGYFMGYRALAQENTAIASKHEMFLWLNKGDQIHLVSLDHYKLVNIRMSTGVASTRILCTDAWTSGAIVAELIAIADELKKRGWSDDTGLIDTSKYTDVSKVLKEEVEGNEQAVARPIYGHNRSGASYEGGSTASYPKKEVHTSTIKRTSKYDAAAAIEAMKAKVQAIRDGKYDPPKLKEFKEAAEEKAGSGRILP